MIFDFGWIVLAVSIAYSGLQFPHFLIGVIATAWITFSAVLSHIGYQNIILRVSKPLPLFGLLATLQFSNPQHIIIGFMCISAGYMGNFIVMMANGYRMPVAAFVFPDDSDVSEYKEMIRSGNQKTRMNLLGDWIPLMGYLHSPGDMLISVGTLIAAVEIYFFF